MKTQLFKFANLSEAKLCSWKIKKLCCSNSIQF